MTSTFGSVAKLADTIGTIGIILTFGAQVMCMPGTGRVVMYMVTQRYRYSVPTMKKKRRPMMDLPRDRETC